jgi:hypothetical protein
LRLRRYFVQDFLPLNESPRGIAHRPARRGLVRVMWLSTLLGFAPLTDLRD